MVKHLPERVLRQRIESELHSFVVTAELGLWTTGQAGQIGLDGWPPGYGDGAKHCAETASRRCQWLDTNMSPQESPSHRISSSRIQRVDPLTENHWVQDIASATPCTPPALSAAVQMELYGSPSNLSFTYLFCL